MRGVDVFRVGMAGERTGYAAIHYYEELFT